ncbi:MAG TPA: CHAT domain-containing protein, partial [Pyrinomonadaceae bacterium]|nr:CHAT domain-containing protein [Pyrinomonadaceae bacterium]
GGGSRDPSEAGSGDPESVTLERYPSMAAQDEVEVGVEFPLEVSLSADQPPEGERAGVVGSDKETVTIKVPWDDEWVIKVNLLATGFKVKQGTSATSAFVLRREGESGRAAFYLIPDEIDGERVERTIYASLWHGQNYIARISRKVTVISTALAGKSRLNSERKATATDRAAEGSDRASGGGGAVGVGNANVAPRSVNRPVPFSAPPAVGAPPPPPPPKSEVRRALSTAPQPIELAPDGPDLTFHYFKAERAGDFNVIVGGRVLQISSQTVRANYKSEELAALLKSYYEDFAQMGARDINAAGQARAPRSEEARAKMRDLGKRLYEQFAPQEFKNAFLAVSRRLGDSFKTIQIITDDPTLPWELMLVPDGEGVERGFLGVEFSVGRWHDGHGAVRFQPPRLFTHETLVMIAPRYEAGAIEGPQDEARALESFYGYRREPGQKATFEQLAKEFPRGIVHFAGHGMVVTATGAFPRYLIRLEDGDLDLRDWRGRITDQSTHNPLVFFNACSVGQAHGVVSFVDGWAPTFLETGASGYIGALWPVGDRSAAEFSKQFYAALQQRLTRRDTSSPAEILKETRRSFADNGDPTYMAYVFYGNPTLTISLQPDK